MMERVAARELMDDAVDEPVELAENLTDIERANRWFGVAAPVAAFVRVSRASSVLDVGCGSADIPLALARDAQRRGAELRVTCLDRSAQMLEIARARTGNHPSLSFVEADGERLPFADGAFDIATCNLALHHFEPPAAVRLLSELRRVSAVSPLVCDLRRSRLAYLGALAFAYATSRNRLTRHDAPLSVRRAYTPGEAVALANAAGWRSPVVRLQPFFRMLLHDR
jgi:SAM-dependent methyltransferase